MDQREAEMEDAGACDAEPRLRREVEREKRRRWAAGEEEKDWAVGKDSGRAGLGCWAGFSVLFLSPFLFPFLFQTNSNYLNSNSNSNSNLNSNFTTQPNKTYAPA